jgi:anti-sigma B factor antagonist
MEVTVREIAGVHVVELAGQLDANTSPAAQRQIMDLVAQDARILLDMAGVSFMSSAGVRLLLSTYREVKARQATVALAGLSSDIADTLSATGFLPYFAVYATQESGVAALQVQR